MPKKKDIIVDIPEDVLVDGKLFKGNENLLSKKSTFKWTDSMIEDFKLCNKSILHFAENHFFITTLDDGKRKIELYKYQKKILKALKANRFTTILSSRQSGKCLKNTSLIKIRNKQTLEIEELTIEEFYNRHNK